MALGASGNEKMGIVERRAMSRHFGRNSLKNTATHCLQVRIAHDLSHVAVESHTPLIHDLNDLNTP